MQALRLARLAHATAPTADVVALAKAAVAKRAGAAAKKPTAKSRGGPYESAVAIKPEHSSPHVGCVSQEHRHAPMNSKLEDSLVITPSVASPG